MSKPGLAARLHLVAGFNRVWRMKNDGVSFGESAAHFGRHAIIASDGHSPQHRLVALHKESHPFRSSPKQGAGGNLQHSIRMPGDDSGFHAETIAEHDAVRN